MSALSPWHPVHRFKYPRVEASAPRPLCPFRHAPRPGPWHHQGRPRAAQPQDQELATTVKRSVHRASRLDDPLKVAGTRGAQPNQAEALPAGRLPRIARGHHLSDPGPVEWVAHRLGRPWPPLPGVRPKASASATAGRTPPQRSRSSPARTRRAMRPRLACQRRPSLEQDDLTGIGGYGVNAGGCEVGRQPEARVTQRTPPTLC
jgi:hypothetical protein